MIIEDSSIQHKVQLHFFPKVLVILLNYIKFLPLTGVFGYMMFCITVLLIDTTYERGFFNLVALTMRKDSSDLHLDITDVSKMFFIWWFVFGTLFQVISSLFKKKVSKYNWFLIFSAVLFLLTIVLVLKFNNIFVPLLLFSVVFACLAAYHILSIITEKFKKVLKKL
jgi:hypothetical protein